jgi:hypothetical protein
MYLGVNEPQRLTCKGQNTPAHPLNLVQKSIKKSSGTMINRIRRKNRGEVARTQVKVMDRWPFREGRVHVDCVECFLLGLRHRITV